MSEGQKIPLDSIAAVTHAANKAWCEQLGDNSQAEWKDAPDWQRASAINGVEFHLANPDASASASHDNWLAEKKADGWTYGTVKDPEKKQHPCMVPFVDLPFAQQTKDRLFRSIVHAIIPPALGQLTVEAQQAPADDQVRTEPLDWPDMAPFGIDSTTEHAAGMVAAAQHFMREVLGGTIMVPAMFYALPQETCQALAAYVLQRRPSAEVLFNKMRELGIIPGSFEELPPVYRGELELAVRVIPAVAGALEAMNAAIVERNPPPAPEVATAPVALEDTILEQVDGMGDIDPERAAAQAKADQAAAEREAPAKKSKGKKARSTDGDAGSN